MKTSERSVFRLHILAFLVVLSLGACSGAKRDADLEQGVRVARYMTSARHLRQSMYTGVRESGAPSELVSYLFSSLGAAERPPSGEISEMEMEQARAISMPVLPADVALVPFAPDPNAKKQIVMKADDAQGLIIAEAYLAPDLAPAFSDSWPMPEFRER